MCPKETKQTYSVELLIPGLTREMSAYFLKKKYKSKNTAFTEINLFLIEHICYPEIMLLSFPPQI